MATTFGKRVAGEKEFLAAIKAQEGGAEVFGKRVRGTIPEPTAELAAKRASEFGIRTIAHAHMTDARGKATDAVDVEQLETILDENATFFDSLYEGEMARKGGPRKDALLLFARVELGPKGQGRNHVIEEINGHLGNPRSGVDARLKNEEALAEVYANQAERMEENKLLGDAPRLKALAEREENLRLVQKSSSRSGAKQAMESDPSIENQVRAAKGETGDEKGETKSKPAAKKSSAKADKAQKRRAKLARAGRGAGPSMVSKKADAKLEKDEGKKE